MRQAMKLKQAIKVPWLAAIALIVIAAAVGAWYYLIPTQLPQAYQYKYPSTLELRSKTRQESYGQEIAFYQERIRRNPGDGLDLACENCHIRYWYPDLASQSRAGEATLP